MLKHTDFQIGLIDYFPYIAGSHLLGNAALKNLKDLQMHICGKKSYSEVHQAVKIKVCAMAWKRIHCYESLHVEGQDFICNNLFRGLV
jgi:hypothetical protein